MVMGQRNSVWKEQNRGQAKNLDKYLWVNMSLNLPKMGRKIYFSHTFGVIEQNHCFSEHLYLII